jgi:hypothetical protein
VPQGAGPGRVLDDRLAETAKTDSCGASLCPWQRGQEGVSRPRTRASKRWSQAWQMYSKMGMLTSNVSGNHRIQHAPNNRCLGARASPHSFDDSMNLNIQLRLEMCHRFHHANFANPATPGFQKPGSSSRHYFHGARHWAHDQTGFSGHRNCRCARCRSFGRRAAPGQSDGISKSCKKADCAMAHLAQRGTLQLCSRHERLNFL